MPQRGFVAKWKYTLIGPAPLFVKFWKDRTAGKSQSISVVQKRTDLSKQCQASWTGSRAHRYPWLPLATRRTTIDSINRSGRLKPNVFREAAFGVYPRSLVGWHGGYSSAPCHPLSSRDQSRLLRAPLVHWPTFSITSDRRHPPLLADIVAKVPKNEAANFSPKNETSDNRQSIGLQAGY
jgi:hypothetical protein